MSDAYVNALCSPVTAGLHKPLNIEEVANE